MHRSIEERIEFVLGKVEELGLAVHPQSRLAQEAAVFRNDDGAYTRLVDPGDPRFADGLEALRDFQLFEFILDRWPFPKSDRDAEYKLRTALKDAINPYAEAKQTQGRDTQLELYVAAVLHGSGLQVDLTTPDVRARMDNRFFYVEAKRPKSVAAIEEAVRKATKQIVKTGCPGAVFLDVSLAFTPRRAVITRIMPDKVFRPLHVKALKHCIAGVDSEVARIVSGKPVAVVCFQDHQVRQVLGGWSVESCCVTRTNPTSTVEQKRLARRFERSLDWGVQEADAT